MARNVEIRARVGDDQSVAQGEGLARELLAELGIDGAQLVAGAYIDLIEERQATR